MDLPSNASYLKFSVRAGTGPPRPSGSFSLGVQAKKEGLGRSWLEVPGIVTQKWLPAGGSLTSTGVPCRKDMAWEPRPAASPSPVTVLVAFEAWL